VISSHVTEMIAKLFNLRIRNLENAIRMLFQEKKDGPYFRQFFNHPLIYRLSLNPKKNTSFIPKKNFTMAFLDIISGYRKDIKTASDVRESIYKIKSPVLRDQMLLLVDDMAISTAQTKEIISEWFEVSMARASNIYKRRARLITIIVAVVMTVSLNIDTISISSYLFSNQTVRTAVVDAAQQRVESQTLVNDGMEIKPAADTSSLGEIKINFDEIGNEIKTLDSLMIPIGWSDQGYPVSRNNIFLKFFGLLMTAYAVSLGSRFWFDMLGRVINLRNDDRKTGKGKKS